MSANYTSDATICDLPYEIWLRIFMLISPDDVLTLRSVCRKLYTLGSSETLWKTLLEKDMESWTIVSHSHNPLVGSSRPAMDVYRICRPRRSELCLPLSAVRNSSLFAQFFGSLKSIMGSWAQADVPRVAVFGPGIESPRTSNIVNQLLGLPAEQNSNNGSSVMQLIEFLRPPPGAAGLGGGLVELLATGQRFHMLILYTEFKDLRERESDTRDRLVRSPFFTEQQIPNPKTKELFSSLSGVIYVVDSTCPSGKVPPSSDNELNLLCQLAPPAAPLLVLAAFGDETSENRSANHRVSPASCVRQLGLCSIVRPWQACAVRVVSSGADQLTVPVNWLGTSAVHAM